MAFSRGLLWLNTVLFGAYGLAYIVAPAFFTRLLTGAEYQTPAAVIDARAVYGGMALGLAAFLWLTVRGGLELQRVGQLGCAITYACVAFGRFVGIYVSKSPSVLAIALLSAEALFAALSWYAYQRLEKDERYDRVKQRSAIGG